MGQLVVAAVALLATASASFAQSAFTGSVEIRRPNTNGAVIRALISYDFAGRRYRLDYQGRSYREIFKFNPASTEPNETADWKYSSGDKCQGGCRAQRIDHAFPVYRNDPLIYQASPGPDVPGCAHYSRVDPGSTPITDIWFHSTTGNICRALWSDGTEYRFPSISAASFVNSFIFDEPDDCVGTDRLDLLVLVDRSASISSGLYDAARQFIRSFVRESIVSPAQVHVSIVQFDVRTEMILDFYEGTSLANIDAGLSAMSCDCSDTLDRKLKPQEVGLGVPACCGRRTSISAALDSASLLLANNGRVDPSPTWLTRKAVVVITDGRPNTLRDGVTPCSGASCRADLNAALKDIKQAHHSLELYAVPVDPADQTGLAFELFSSIASFVPGPHGCPALDYCDPTTCGGVCECAACTAPSGCDASGDFCQINTVVGAGCELRPRNCALEPNFTNRCLAAFCNAETQGCETNPIECPASTQSCMTRRCVPETGECTTDVFPDSTCTHECDLNTPGQCNDNNACTVDLCVATDGFRTCKFIPKTCDDGDPCTQDYCIDPDLGCQTIPEPSTFCDDDLSCTADTCISGVGCTHTVLSCDDGQPCTEDTCDPELGHCLNRDATCPISTTQLFGACWALGGWGEGTGVGEDCNAVCGELGLSYDDATRTIAGSHGTDANCLAVLRALGVARGPLEAPSADCRGGRGGVGCFSDVMYSPGVPGEGRCARPVTDATSKSPWNRRACACH